MQSRKRLTNDNLPTIPARVYSLIGGDKSAHAHAENTPAYYRTATPRRSNHAGELQRRSPSQSPRLWNETLVLAADG